MSALEIHWTPSVPSRHHLRLVTESEISSVSLRKAHAKRVARAQAWACAKAYAGLGAVVAVFGSAAVTMVWSFFAVPNVPLP